MSAAAHPTVKGGGLRGRTGGHGVQPLPLPASSASPSTAGVAGGSAKGGPVAAALRSKVGGVSGVAPAGRQMEQTEQQHLMQGRQMKKLRDV